MEKIFTMKEAAEYLHYSMSTLRRRIDAGKIKTFKDGKLVRIKESELQKFIDGNQNSSTEPVKEKSTTAVFAQKSSISLEQALKENRKE